MNPRLSAVSGPLQGSTFQLTDQELSIGRDNSNVLSISDLLLSRRHCVIRKDGEKFTIRDLDSLNGIFVNKIRTKERTLQQGDQIELGESLFVFLQNGETSNQAEVNESPITAQSTTSLRMEDLDYYKDASLQSLPSERLARDLRSLLQISKALNSVENVADLQNKLAEAIFQALPADRYAILLGGENSTELSPAYAVDRHTGNTIQVSNFIIQQVLENQSAILCNGVAHDRTFDKSASLAASKIQSLLCVPLVVSNKTVGVLYLDSSDPTVVFDEEHLQLFAGIAGIAAVALKKAGQVEHLKNENRRLHAEIDHQMVGESPAMQKIYQLLAKVAPADSTVLIYGETGTGKELTARAIHLNSPRANKSFIAINCAAVTETLLESEMFGHEKGAFTGAIAQKKGKFELAEGGTLFLDEISEFAPALQAKLLRVLQEREFERVGGTRTIRLDVRLIAATNKNLEEMVKAGSFRQDLFFRLNVVSIKMPALRERREDISLLASYFAAKHSKKLRRAFAGISPDAMQFLMHYEWPGNVRELENTIEYALVMGSCDQIVLEDLPESLLDLEPSGDIRIANYYERIKETKKQLIQDAFEEASGDHNQAAKLLGLHPNSLHRMIRNLKLKVKPRT